MSDSYEEQVGGITNVGQLLPGDVAVQVDGSGARVSRKHGDHVSAPTKSPDWGQPMPWGLRLAYALRCLQGRVRVAPNTIDASRLETEGFLEGTIRVQMKPGRIVWTDGD